MELGWDVARFWVYEIRDDTDACIQRIYDWLKVNRTANGNF